MLVSIFKGGKTDDVQRQGEETVGCRAEGGGHDVQRQEGKKWLASRGEGKKSVGCRGEGEGRDVQRQEEKKKTIGEQRQAENIQWRAETRGGKPGGEQRRGEKGDV